MPCVVTPGVYPCLPSYSSIDLQLPTLGSNNLEHNIKYPPSSRASATNRSSCPSPTELPVNPPSPPHKPSHPHEQLKSSSTSTISSQYVQAPSALIEASRSDSQPQQQQPSRLSTLLWTVGSSLLHTGVVISTREYAYGGHSVSSTTGVYYTRPGFEPPGGHFRTSILAGVTSLSEEEIEEVVKRVSERFLGEGYNLLTNNCNHFTRVLCRELCGKEPPGWLNRAAGIGVRLPCVVPREWVSAPDVETQEGCLVDEEDEVEGEEDDERAGMLGREWRAREQQEERERALRMKGNARMSGGGGMDGREGRRRRSIPSDGVGEEDMHADNDIAAISLAGGKKIPPASSSPPPRLVKIKSKDSAGRELPVAERAPVPTGRKT